MVTTHRLEPGDYRKQYADFLDRLATSAVESDEWESFIVTHYPDEFLEEMRCCTVRLAIGELAHGIASDEGKQLLRAWAMAIRSSVKSTNT